jgi:AP-1 complex subunit mu
MPECKLGLNDRVLLEAQGRTTKGKAIDLEDIKFHQYVRSTFLSLQIDPLRVQH